MFIGRSVVAVYPTIYHEPRRHNAPLSILRDVISASQLYQRFDFSQRDCKLLRWVVSEELKAMMAMNTAIRDWCTQTILIKSLATSPVSPEVW